jgi:hypothetical protein
MPTQQLLEWSCLYCNNHHKWWRDPIDIPNQEFSVKCKRCNNTHKLKVINNQTTITYPTENGVFLNIGIKEFVKLLPEKPDHRRTFINKDKFYRNWAEHDALHFISGSPFDEKGEQQVAYLEKKFKCGWHETNEYVKLAVPCDWQYITDDLIKSVSVQIMEEIVK